MPRPGGAQSCRTGHKCPEDVTMTSSGHGTNPFCQASWVFPGDGLSEMTEDATQRHVLRSVVLFSPCTWAKRGVRISPPSPLDSDHAHGTRDDRAIRQAFMPCELCRAVPSQLKERPWS